MCTHADMHVRMCVRGPFLRPSIGPPGVSPHRQRNITREWGLKEGLYYRLKFLKNTQKFSKNGRNVVCVFQNDKSIRDNLMESTVYICLYILIALLDQNAGLLLLV